ncbi:hypothetical protein C4566_02410 [Candidatus Parcubacteria bacterium]|nr:MAG: hypothetical protein C4566_02410 [Candidatus Parcubacteria bacterium]
MGKKIKWKHLRNDIYSAVGVILIWRGVWYLLDEADKLIFGGSHIWTTIIGVIAGLIILYLPDGDLKELEK